METPWNSGEFGGLHSQVLAERLLPLAVVSVVEVFRSPRGSLHHHLLCTSQQFAKLNL